jgi:hypothetical protein
VSSQPPAQLGAAHALVVVLQANDVGPFESVRDALQQALHQVLAQVVAHLQVEPEHLLRVAVLGQADHAPLDRRGARRVLQQALGVTPRPPEGLPQRLGLPVGAHHTEAQHLGLQLAQAQAHVGRAAGAVLEATRLEDRDRGVGAEPLGGAIHGLVEHEVADHQRREGLPGCKLLDQGGHVRPTTRLREPAP